MFEGSAVSCATLPPFPSFIRDVLQIGYDPIDWMAIPDDRKDETFGSNEVVPVSKGTQRRFMLRVAQMVFEADMTDEVY